MDLSNLKPRGDTGARSDLLQNLGRRERASKSLNNTSSILGKRQALTSPRDDLAVSKSTAMSAKFAHSSMVEAEKLPSHMGSEPSYNLRNLKWTPNRPATKGLVYHQTTGNPIQIDLSAEQVAAMLRNGTVSKVPQQKPMSTSSESSTNVPDINKRRRSTAKIDFDDGTGPKVSHIFNSYQSSTNGHASPVPGADDYANMFANPPYGVSSNRTRTSSNASIVEPWTYPSRSTTSATSTMPYSWASTSISPDSSNVAYMTSSYPMTSIPMAAGVSGDVKVNDSLRPSHLMQRRMPSPPTLHFPTLYDGLEESSRSPERDYTERVTIKLPKFANTVKRNLHTHRRHPKPNEHGWQTTLHRQENNEASSLYMCYTISKDNTVGQEMGEKEKLVAIKSRPRVCSTYQDTITGTKPTPLREMPDSVSMLEERGPTLVANHTSQYQVHPIEWQWVTPSFQRMRASRAQSS
jgi:hypothetical protein